MRPATLVALAVVMPAYNEEASIAAAVDEVRTKVLDRVPSSRLTVVDDGSRDRTGALLDQIASGEPRLTVVHQPNAGHGAAVITGLDAVDAEWILLLDSDRQIPLDAFEDAWQKRPAVAAVLGRRVGRRENASRRVITAVLRNALRWALGCPLTDANAPFKLFRREVWVEARQLIGPDCLIPSVFIAACVHRSGLPYATQPVAHRPRAGGAASLTSLKLLKFCFRAMAQLLEFRGALRRTYASGAARVAPAVITKQ